VNVMQRGDAPALLRLLPVKFGNEGEVASCGILLTIVEPSTWKKFHQLRGGDKEGSRQRALHLFPTAQALLTRKRDHGRADAALIALAAGAPIKPNATEIVIRLADRENSYA
jgi:hypothetical protein